MKIDGDWQKEISAIKNKKNNLTDTSRHDKMNIERGKHMFMFWVFIAVVGYGGWKLIKEIDLGIHASQMRYDAKRKMKSISDAMLQEMKGERNERS